MNIFGQYSSARATLPSGPLSANTTVVSRYTSPVAGYIAKLSVYIAGGASPQPLRGVVYSRTSGWAGALGGTSNEVIIAAHQPLGWVDFVFPVPVLVAAGDLLMGIANGSPASAQAYAVDKDDLGVAVATDTYSDGPAATFTSAATYAWRLALFATVVRPWDAPDNVDDFYIGRLPFTESQALFSVGGPLASPVFQVKAGWYGTNIDDDRGAFAIVQAGSPLEVLLGERIRLTRTDEFVQSPVYLFVKNSYDLLEEIAMPRGMFARLGGLSADDITVRVEVIAS